MKKKNTHKLEGCRCPKGSDVRFCLGLTADEAIKREISFNMLCPRCGLAGHSPKDYKKCVKSLNQNTK